MSFLKIVNGDLLNASETYIAHQCNCISINAFALAQSIFDAYPYSNTYNKRIRNNIRTYSKPGTIDIVGDINKNQKCIINMYAQYYPSISKYNNDTNEKRIKWFQECLNHIPKDIKSIAMPYNIGCASAGGDWNIYFKMLDDFANNNQIEVTLYKLVI